MNDSELTRWFAKFSKPIADDIDALFARKCHWCHQTFGEHRVGGPIARMICRGQATGFEPEPPPATTSMRSVPYPEYEAT